MTVSAPPPGEGVPPLPESKLPLLTSAHFWRVHSLTSDARATLSSNLGREQHLKAEIRLGQLAEQKRDRAQSEFEVLSRRTPTDSTVDLSPAARTLASAAGVAAVASPFAQVARDQYRSLQDSIAVQLRGGSKQIGEAIRLVASALGFNPDRFHYDPARFTGDQLGALGVTVHADRKAYINVWALQDVSTLAMTVMHEGRHLFQASDTLDLVYFPPTQADFTIGGERTLRMPEATLEEWKSQASVSREWEAYMEGLAKRADLGLSKRDIAYLYSAAKTAYPRLSPVAQAEHKAAWGDLQRTLDQELGPAFGDAPRPGILDEIYRSVGRPGGHSATWKNDGSPFDTKIEAELDRLLEDIPDYVFEPDPVHLSSADPDTDHLSDLPSPVHDVSTTRHVFSASDDEPGHSIGIDADEVYHGGSQDLDALTPSLDEPHQVLAPDTGHGASPNSHDDGDGQVTYLDTNHDGLADQSTGSDLYHPDSLDFTPAPDEPSSALAGDADHAAPDADHAQPAQGAPAQHDHSQPEAGHDPGGDHAAPDADPGHG